LRGKDRRVTVTRTMIGLATATLVLASDGYAVPHPGETIVAQRGGRGFRGAGGRGHLSAGIRTIAPGNVTAVDPERGRITLTVGGATVEAEFPAAVVATVKPGDRVMLTLELIDTRVGVVAGPVTAVDPVTGAVTLNTPHGAWTTTFSPLAVAAIRPGDQAVVKLDLTDLGPSIEPPTLLPGPSAPPPGGTR
jgi:hypothetical protein